MPLKPLDSFRIFFICQTFPSCSSLFQQTWKRNIWIHGRLMKLIFRDLLLPPGRSQISTSFDMHLKGAVDQRRSGLSWSIWICSDTAVDSADSIEVNFVQTQSKRAFRESEGREDCMWWQWGEDSTSCHSLLFYGFQCWEVLANARKALQQCQPSKVCKPRLLNFKISSCSRVSL